MAKLTTSQIAAMIGVSERTIQRWIAEGKLPAQSIARRQYLVAERDIEALRPSQVEETISQTEERIQALESLLSALEGKLEDLTHLSGRLHTLEIRLTALERDVSALRELLEAQGARQAPTPAPKVLRPTPAQYTVASGDLVTARSFAERHRVTRDRMDSLCRSGAIEVTWVPYRDSRQPNLNLDQQRDAIKVWQERYIPFGLCPVETCPCHEP